MNSFFFNLLIFFILLLYTAVFLVVIKTGVREPDPYVMDPVYVLGPLGESMNQGCMFCAPPLFQIGPLAQLNASLVPGYQTAFLLCPENVHELT